MFKKKNHSDPFRERLNKVLFPWPGYSSDTWTIADALRGTQIKGATGSGKTSGPGKKIAMAFLREQFGGLVLCAKPDERITWEEYINEAGREKDKVIFNKSSGLQFNPLVYEMSRPGSGRGETLNLVDMIMNIQEIGKNYMSGGGGGISSEGFWEDALRQCMSRTIDLLKLAGEDVTIANMRKILVTALTREEVQIYKKLAAVVRDQNQTIDVRTEKMEEIKAWEKESYCIGCLRKAAQNKDKTPSEIETYELVESYFSKEFSNLAERTRSVVVQSFLGLVEPFLSGILKDHFSKGISRDLLPEGTFLKNKIIILDWPVKEFLVAGIYAQAIYKFIFQQAMERRNPREEKDSRPTFLWVDESQFFINPNYDMMFQTTARSSLVCTVYLTQSINNYYFTMGKHSPTARAKSLLSNLATKIFCANSDYDTNLYAAQTIGEEFETTFSSKRQFDGSDYGSMSEQMLFQVKPKEFTMLKCGGTINDCKVESIVVLTGRNWSTGNNYLRVEFDQNE